MIRICADEDISDEELEKVINLFYGNYHEYIITYVMHEVIAFYIASSYSSNALADRKNTNCEKAGVKQIRLHDLRYSCASLLINKGANIQVVAKYLGQTKIEKTLKTYSHLFISTLDEIINVIYPLEK